jgi:gluconolactonase
MRSTALQDWCFEVSAGPFEFAEGPAWDGSGLVFSDIPSGRVLRYDPETRLTQVLHVHTNEGNGLMFDADGRLYGCQGGGEGRRIVRYEPDRRVTVIVDRFEGRRFNSPNDLAFDRLGRLWFTDPRYGERREDMELNHESVYRCDPQPDGSWTVQRVTYDTTRPNGLLVSPDGSTLYVAQSEYGEGNPRELRAYPILPDGSLGDYQVLHNFYPHRGIDGMCLDAEGNIGATAGWTKSGPGPMIYVFASNGRVLETHPVPSDLPTNCTWGGPEPDRLYVTTGSGHLLTTRTGRRPYLIYPPTPTTAG